MSATICQMRVEDLKLIWRPEPHSTRLIVGTLRRVEEGFVFRYDGPDLSRAKTLGFVGYPGMTGLAKTYNGIAMNAFSARLPGRDRPDFAQLVGAWHVSASADDFIILSATGGRLPTDMFEFIPVIEPERGTAFLTALAGLQHYEMSEEFRRLPPGTKIELRRNPNNQWDPYAIEARYASHHVAHIKRVHAESVWKALESGLDVRCRLERVRSNGRIQEAIVEICFT